MMRGVAMTILLALLAFALSTFIVHVSGATVEPDDRTWREHMIRNIALASGVRHESGAQATGPMPGVVAAHNVNSALAPSLALGTRPPLVAGAAIQDHDARSRFTYLDILVDSGDAPLAAYQLDVRAIEGDVRIVGIEGGEHRVFADPPHYDPAAMMNDRVIIAAFSLAADADLPRGRTRIARLHIQVVGDARPRFEAEITVAGDPNAQKIPAEVILQMGAEQT